MIEEPKLPGAPLTSLRAAAAEALLSGSLLLADVARQVQNYDPSTSQAKQSEERFRKALEALRESLS